MRHFAFAITIALCAACSAESKDELPGARTEAAADSAPGQTGLIAGTPAGDLEEWLSEMRARLDTVDAAVEADRATAHRHVLDLYVSRQEYLEMYYGETGRLNPTAELADAVMQNEARFHDLMKLTGAIPPAPADDVRKSIAALREQMDVVQGLASARPRRVEELRKGAVQ